MTAFDLTTAHRSYREILDQYKAGLLSKVQAIRLLDQLSIKCRASGVPFVAKQGVLDAIVPNTEAAAAALDEDDEDDQDESYEEPEESYEESYEEDSEDDDEDDDDYPF